MSGIVEPATPGRTGSFFGEDVYLSQELEGQDPRAPYRFMVLILAFALGTAAVLGIERIAARRRAAR